MNANDSFDFWNDVLRLKGFQVVHVRRDTPADPIRLTLIPTTPLGVCPSCHQACDTIHRRHESGPVKDLSIGPQSVELLIRTYQFECTHCNRYFTPLLPGFVPRAHATERFLEQAARLIRVSDMTNAAAFLGVPEKTLERWYYDYVERRQQAPPTTPQPIQEIGIDELTLKKRQGSSSR